jgi:hypothetical protein
VLVVCDRSNIRRCVIIWSCRNPIADVEVHLPLIENNNIIALHENTLPSTRFNLAPRVTSYQKTFTKSSFKTPTTLQLSRTNATIRIPSTQSLKIRLSVTLYLHTRVAAVAACAGKAQANEIEKNPPGEALL